MFMFMFTGFLISKHGQKQVSKPWSYFVEGYIVGLWKAMSTKSDQICNFFRAVAQLKSQLADQESWKIPSDPKSESGIHNQDCDDSDSSNSDDNDSKSGQ